MYIIILIYIYIYIYIYVYVFMYIYMYYGGAPIVLRFVKLACCPEDAIAGVVCNPSGVLRHNVAWPHTICSQVPLKGGYPLRLSFAPRTP